MSDDSGVIQYVDVERSINSETISKYTLRVGSELVVKLLNKQKLKHRDRRVQVLSFIEEPGMYGLRVNVKFLDNGRRGKIKISDLDEI